MKCFLFLRSVICLIINVIIMEVVAKVITITNCIMINISDLELALIVFVNMAYCKMLNRIVTCSPYSIYHL